MLGDVVFLAKKLEAKKVFAKNNVEIENNMSEMNALMATIKLAKKLK